MELETLKQKLQFLREKWTNKVPNPHDKDYLQFRVDKCYALSLIKRIKFLEGELTVSPFKQKLSLD